ncbi:MAG: ABC transporter permease [Victivallales bacterium]|nr:ABC transporter permease [Victivallales bacterium]
MPIILKLVYRDFLRRRSLLTFALLAIMATCCLIVWFVASIDVSAFADDNGTSGFFGEYSLALAADRRFPEQIRAKIEKLETAEKVAYARQTSAKILLDGYDQALKPSGMGDRQYPFLLAISDDKPPFDLQHGQWPQNPLECVVGSAAAELHVAVPGETARRKVRLGDRLKVSTDQGDFLFTVTGLLKQQKREDFRGRVSGTFNFGFGIGIGGRQMGEGRRPTPDTPSVKVSQPEATSERFSRDSNGRADTRPSPPSRGPQSGPRRPGGRFARLEVSPTSPSVYILPSDLVKVCGREMPPNLVFVQLADGLQPSQFYRDLETACGATLAEMGIKTYDTTPKQQEGQVSQEQVIGQAWSTIGIVIVASVFIIFTTLSMGVSENIRFLSMLRTIGFTKGQVALYIILEGLALGLLGWLGGLFAGWLLLTILVFLQSGVIPLVTLSASSILFALGCSLAGAFLASLLPAWRATRIAPAESLVRDLHALSPRQLFWSGLTGSLLLLLIPVLVFWLPFATKTRLLLFTTAGTTLLAVGFLLFIPWTVAFSEKLLGRLLAAALGLPHLFLKQILTGNFWRTLGTTLALSIGLGLFTAIHIWGSSMLNMFWVPTTIPDVLVRFQEGVIGEFTADGLAQMPGILPESLLRVSVAQPNLRPDLQRRLAKGHAVSSSNIVLRGLDGDRAFRHDNPLLRLKFLAGNRDQAREAFTTPGARVCVIPETLAVHANLQVGDKIALEKSSRRPISPRLPPGQIAEPPPGTEYAEYTVVGIVDFAWVWLSKCAGVRVSSGGTGGLVFTPFAPLLEDFGALDGEFFWFDKKPTLTYAQISDYLRNLAREAARRNPLAAKVNSYAGGTRWDSGINRHFVLVNSNESLNNSLASRAFGVLDAMAKMPLVILVLATLAVINTMIVSVRTRAWEMGVLRACGVTRNCLLRLILAEALLIGICACVTSFCFGLFYSWLAISLVDYAPMFGVIAPPLTIPFAKLLPGYLIAIAVCALAGLFPAFRTSLRETSTLLQKHNT